VRLLASTDFALRVLIALGQRPSGETVNVETLARSLGGLSRNHLHKIVQDLAALGIVKTIRGAGGGVALAKAPREVRIGALVRTLEADQALVECFRADHGTARSIPDAGCGRCSARRATGFTKRWTITRWRTASGGQLRRKAAPPLRRGFRSLR